jgi:integrase/recombinase XerC
MMAQGLRPATRNRRLSAVRSALKLGRQLGLLNWALESPGERTVAYRDTVGPGEPAYRAMLDAAAGARDAAILRLLHDLGLRRGEVCTLDMEHLDPRAARISVLGKGRQEREWLTLPPETQKALDAWLAERGSRPGPVFVSRSRACPGHRLTGEAVRQIVSATARRAGLDAVRPHGLRHTAITSALALTGGDVRRVQRFSRHRQIQTVLIYDDARRDIAGEVAALVARSVITPDPPSPPPP